MYCRGIRTRVLGESARSLSAWPDAALAKKVGFGIVGPPLWFFPLCPPRTRMDRLFNRKPKKSLKSPQRHITLGIPTNIAAGPLGFRADLDAGSTGEQDRPYHDSEADGPDPTAAPDEKDIKAQRIVFQEKESEGQGSTATGVSTSDAVVGGIEHLDDATSECFFSCCHSRCSTGCDPPRQRKTLATSQREKTSHQRCWEVCVEAIVAFDSC